MDSSLDITLPKKGNLQLCQSYSTISLISHPSKVMLKVILNRLQPQVEEIIAEEQDGFRAGKSTTEQIFNLRILCEKYLQHQQNLCHVFIGFKKAEIQRQCQHHTCHWKSVWQRTECSPVQWQHRRLVQNYSRSPTRVSTLTISLQRLPRENHMRGTGWPWSIGGRLITIFCFADDIVVNAEEKEEAGVLVDRLDTTTKRYTVEIGPDKTNVMTNNPNGFQRDIKIKGQTTGSDARGSGELQVPGINHL